jgi:ferredoxin
MHKMRHLQTGLSYGLGETEMKTVKAVINNRDIEVQTGTTVLQAARALNIRIPALCHLNGYKPFTSCMVCVVLDAGSDRLIPSCSAAVSEGMRIETDHPRVKEARKDALDFLLSEHVGDCEAPCHRACPAHMNIPLMIRQIEDNRLEEAIVTVKRDIALPAVLGRICPAPCEKGCHRRSLDSPVSICSLKRYVADADLARASPYKPDMKPDSGNKVAVVGAGPAGLAAAYYLRRYGHSCHVYDRNPKPGGMLRYGVPREDLPESVLEAEIELISGLGVEFRMGWTLGENLLWEELRDVYDAVVLATGTIFPGLFEKMGLVLSSRGLEIDRRTFQTIIPGVFAGGNAVAESRLAVRAVAHGQGMALSVNQFLSEKKVTGSGRRFQSTVGKIREDDVGELLKEADGRSRIEPKAGSSGGFTGDEAVKESSRCFGCDCRKPDSCRLRQYAEEYAADQRRFTFKERKRIQKIVQHELVIYEPGKCIKCGLCVRIAEKAGEKLGLTFVGRGFDVRVEVPFGEPFNLGLEKAAGECIAACPTAALSWRDRNRRNRTPSQKIKEELLIYRKKEKNDNRGCMF